MSEQERVERALLQELSDRQFEALNIYEPQQRQEAFHACTAKQRIVEGGVRSGKSTCGFVEDARIVLQRDPHRKIVKKGGLLVIVGYSARHIGQVVFPKLFKPGAFQMIRDEKTGNWRTFRPWEPGDMARKKEVKPAPPLIPDRYIARDEHGRRKWSFYKKSENILTAVELVTGWRIWCFTSAGKPEQGFAADVVHIDEDLQDAEWAIEMVSRTADESGLFYWTALPHDTNEALQNMRELADDETANNPGSPRCIRFCLPFVDNPYIPSDQKQLLMDTWAKAGEQILRLRAYGESGQESRLMYPGFSLSAHGMYRNELPNGEIPSHWTRYVIIDPGHQPASVLFAAVPPPREQRPCPAGEDPNRDRPWGDITVIYDELQVLDSSAELLANAVRHKVMGCVIQDIIIDDHGSRAHDTGSGRGIRQQYAEEFRRVGVRAEKTGTEFTLGIGDIEYRSGELRGWMIVREEGGRRLRVLRDSCPKLIRELERYKKKVEHRHGETFITNKPDTRGIHLAVCLEYLAAYDPPYVKVVPKQRKAAESRLARIRRLIAAEQKAEGGGNYIACSAGGK